MKLAAKSDELLRLSQGFTDAVWVYRRKIRHVKTAVRSLEPLARHCWPRSKHVRAAFRLSFSRARAGVMYPCRWSSQPLL